MLEAHIRELGYGLIGYWLNDGKLYIDGVYHIQDKDRALRMARASHQQAIWDFMNSKEIAVKL